MMRKSSTPLSHTLQSNGRSYRVRVLGKERADGTWEGSLEFHDGHSPAICTGEETSQPSLQALEYWATGLEPVYLEGALERALAAFNKKRRG